VKEASGSGVRGVAVACETVDGSGGSSDAATAAAAVVGGTVDGAAEVVEVAEMVEVVVAVVAGAVRVDDELHEAARRPLIARTASNRRRKCIRRV